MFSIVHFLIDAGHVCDTKSMDNARDFAAAGSPRRHPIQSAQANIVPQCWLSSGEPLQYDSGASPRIHAPQLNWHRTKDQELADRRQRRGIAFCGANSIVRNLTAKLCFSFVKWFTNAACIFLLVLVE